MRDELRNADDDLTIDVETALAKLQPRPTSVDRDRVLFLAGQASATTRTDVPNPKRRWLWPAATIVSFAATLLLGVLYGLERNRPEPPARIVYRTIVREPAENVVANRMPPRRKVAAAEVSPPEVTESRMLRRRHPALMTDVDYLPSPPTNGNASPSDQPTVRNMRRSMVGTYSAVDAGANSDANTGFGSFFGLGAR